MQIEDDVLVSRAASLVREHDCRASDVVRYVGEDLLAVLLSKQPTSGEDQVAGGKNSPRCRASAEQDHASTQLIEAPQVVGQFKRRLDRWCTLWFVHHAVVSATDGLNDRYEIRV
jgi:hypothetical protein